jgi:membrane-associated progesterone receptor component
MAKHSFDEEMLTSLDEPIDDLKDLNTEEKEALQEWSKFFEEKYEVVGYLINTTIK